MCADFNYYLNRQGAPGLQGEKGEKGDKGDSITISTGVNTPTEYTLIFDKGDGNSFETGNLKYPMRDDGGTYLRYDRTNNTVTLGYPNIAELNGNAGEVQLATTVTVGNNTVKNQDAVSYELFKSVKNSTDSQLTSLDGRVTYLEQHGGGGGGGTTFTPGAGLNITPDNILYVETDSTISIDQETNELGVRYSNGLEQGSNGTLTTKVDGTTITYNNDGALTAIGGGGTVDAYTKVETDTLLEGKISTSAPIGPLEWLPDTSQGITMYGFPAGQTSVSALAAQAYQNSYYATVVQLTTNTNSYLSVAYDPSIVQTSSAPYVETNIRNINIGGTIYYNYTGSASTTELYSYILGYYNESNLFVPVLTLTQGYPNDGLCLCYINESGGQSDRQVFYKNVITDYASFNSSFFTLSSNADNSILTIAGNKLLSGVSALSEKKTIAVSRISDVNAQFRISKIDTVRIYATNSFSSSDYGLVTNNLSHIKLINPINVITTDGDGAARITTFNSSDNILDAHLEQLNLKYDSNTLGVNSNNELYGKIGDGTITLTQGATTLGTFSVNQSGNQSINIPASGGGGGTSYAAGDGIDISGSNVISTKVDGTTIGIDSSTKEIKLLSSIPTDTSDLTNGAGYITGITSGDVTSALGFTPYSNSNPNGYTSNIGTVTAVNNNIPDSNGNVTIPMPNNMTGATSSTAGSPGLVPAPAAGDNTKFLAGDGTWKDISGANTDLSNLTATGNSKIADMPMPSNSSVSITIPAENGTLTAPYTGYYLIQFHSVANAVFYWHIRDNITTDYLGSGSFTDLWIYHPVLKGTITTFNYGNVVVDNATFVKAIGEVNS